MLRAPNDRVSKIKHLLFSIEFTLCLVWSLVYLVAAVGNFSSVVRVDSIPAWVSSARSSFLPQTKNMRVRLTEYLNFPSIWAWEWVAGEPRGGNISVSILSFIFHKIKLRKDLDLIDRLIDTFHWCQFSQTCNPLSKAELDGHGHSFGALGRLIKRLDTNQHEFPRRISVISVRALPRTPGCSLKYCLLNQCSPLHFVASCQDLLSRRRANSLATMERNQTFETPVGPHTFAGHVSTYLHITSGSCLSWGWDVLSVSSLTCRHDCGE